MRICLLAFISVLFFRCSDDEPLKSQIIDERDGQTYETIRLGGMNWMAEDLKLNGQDTYHYFDALEACPEGWELPTTDEWRALASEAGGYHNYEEVVGDPNQAYNALTNPNGFNGPDDLGYYWSASAAVADVPSLRAETFDFAPEFDESGAAVFLGFTVRTSSGKCRCVERSRKVTGAFEMQSSYGTFNYDDHLETFIYPWNNSLILQGFYLTGPNDVDWIQLSISNEDLQRFNGTEMQFSGRLEYQRTPEIVTTFSNEGRLAYWSPEVEVTILQYDQDNITGRIQGTLTEAEGIPPLDIDGHFSVDLSTLP
ncbi:MAG: hypothetical protein R8G66_29100 [Cytophagales bacterium]|nr:hypothetical protein [Cytophagales bacterium]